MDYKQLLKQEILRRQSNRNNQDRKMEGLLQQNEKLVDLDPSARTDLTPMASFVDQMTGSNLARTVKAPESSQDALRKALQARIQAPKQDMMSPLKTAMADDLGKAELAQKLAKAGRGKELSQNNIIKLQEGENIPYMLQDVAGVINANQDNFGPVWGRAMGLNPYNEKEKTIDAQLRAASQAFGRYMEGGVLRKEDEEKYRKMFPGLGDTPEVAKNKLSVVQRLLGQRQKGVLGTLGKAGYDVGMFNGGGPDANLPGVLGVAGQQQQAQPEQQYNPVINLGDGDVIDTDKMTEAEIDAMIAKIGGK